MDNIKHMKKRFLFIAILLLGILSCEKTDSEKILTSNDFIGTWYWGEKMELIINDDIRLVQVEMMESSEYLYIESQNITGTTLEFTTKTPINRLDLSRGYEIRQGSFTLVSEDKMVGAMALTITLNDKTYAPFSVTFIKL